MASKSGKASRTRSTRSNKATRTTGAPVRSNPSTVVRDRAGRSASVCSSSHQRTARTVMRALRQLHRRGGLKDVFGRRSQQ